MRTNEQLISSAMSVNEHFKGSRILYLINYGSHTYHCANDDSD